MEEILLRIKSQPSALEMYFNGKNQEPKLQL